MELNRRVYERTVFILLLLVGRLEAIPVGYNESDLDLYCINDYENLMFCQLNGKNCSEYSLTLKGLKNHECSLQQCDAGLCCCSVQMWLIIGENHTATVSRKGELLESKDIGIMETIKPRTPTIVAVNKSNGNVEVFWRTNTNKLDGLKAEVTYYIKGSTERVSRLDYPAEVSGYKYYEINGKDLIPNTTYVVRVRSYTDWSEMFSDPSQEWEFTTDLAKRVDFTFMIIIISLSFAAAILTAIIYACFIKLKTKIWDPLVKHPSPELIIYPSKPELWMPERTIISSICVEPLIPTESKPWSKMSLTDISSGSLEQSSGISMSSSGDSYANAEPVEVDVGAKVQDALCKAFANISPVSLLATSPLVELNTESDLLSAPYNPCSSGSSGIDNKTYSIVIPVNQNHVMADGPEVQVQAEIPCDPAYNSSDRETLTCPNLQVPLLPVSPSMASPVLTDMSYQQCNADSGRFSDAEEFSLSSISSGTNTATSCDVESRADAGCESSDDVVSDGMKLNTEKVSIPVGNPNLSRVPAQKFLAVDDDYQAFQNVVNQSAVSLTEQKSGDKHLDNYQEDHPSSKIPQVTLSPVASGVMNDTQSLSGLQTPFLFMNKAAAGRNIPVFTDSGYQSV